MNRLNRAVSRVLVLCTFVCVAVFGLTAAVLAEQSAGSYSVAGVLIEGNQRIDTSAIKLQIKSVPGKVTGEQVKQDVKSLYQTGFFDQVTASLAKLKEKNYLKFTVVEKPTVHKVFIRGNEAISEDDLANVIKLDAHRFLDRTKIDQLIRQATSFYQWKGYYDAAFEYSVLPTGENQVNVTFTVNEGPRYKIREIEIHGLTELDEDDVTDAMETREYSWWSSWLVGSGRLNLEMLENDRNLLRQFFFDRGFIDATISAPLVEKRDGGIYVSFDATEGRRYSIGDISASGDLVDQSTELTLEGISAKTGNVFKASGVRSDAFVISEKFSDNGYAFANVVPDTRIDRGAAQVHLDFRTTKGQLVTVDRINIHGNDKSYDNVIRREIRIEEQQTYSGTKVKRSKTLLERLGYYDEVNITTQPKDDPEMVDLDVQVRKASTGSFSIGAGYSTSEGALFNSRVSENNLFGTGRRLTLNLDVGTESNNTVLTYVDRRFNDSLWLLGVEGMLTDREFTDYDREMNGGSVFTAYPLEEEFGPWAEDVTLGFKYQFLDIDIKNVEPDAAQLVKDSAGKSTSSSILPKLTRSTINNPLNPTKGSEQELELELAGPGGSEEFWLLDLRNQWYHPLYRFEESGDLTFSWRTKFGYGETFDGDQFPLFRRYFPGGINSVRGFKARTLGPKDAQGNEFGGSKQLVNNLELIFPLVEASGIRGVVFFDTGEAFDDNESIDFGELRHAYGFGLRWASPLGPIRVEFGVPVDREEGEDSLVTLFSFGAPL